MTSRISARAIRNARPRRGRRWGRIGACHRGELSTNLRSRRRAMAKRALPELWIVRMAAATCGCGSPLRWASSPMPCCRADWRTVTRALVGWDIGVSSSICADVRDDGRQAGGRNPQALRRCRTKARSRIMVLIVFAAMASLGAIFAELATDGDAPASLWARYRWRSSPSCCPGASSTPSSRFTTPRLLRRRQVRQRPEISR